MKNPTILPCFLLLLGAACANPLPVEMPAPPPDLYVFVEPLSRPAATTPGPPVLVSTASQAAAALGQRVRLLGTAQDAKLSAVVQSEALLVYCMIRDGDGLLVESRWPQGTVGQEVAVTGILEQSEQFTAQVGPDGAISQGTEGPILALFDYDLTLVEQPAVVPEPAAEADPG